jgi:hypothetical protein
VWSSNQDNEFAVCSCGDNVYAARTARNHGQCELPLIGMSENIGPRAVRVATRDAADARRGPRHPRRTIARPPRS